METERFKIGDHKVGEGNQCFIVGEVAQAHDGSLGMAHAFIDAVAAAGADAVKFQTPSPRLKVLPTNHGAFISVRRTHLGLITGGAWSFAMINGRVLRSMRSKRG